MGCLLEQAKKGGQLPRSKSKRTAIPLRTTSLQPATSLSSGPLPPELHISYANTDIQSPISYAKTIIQLPITYAKPSSSYPSATPGHPPVVQKFPPHLWDPPPLWTPPSLQPPRMWTPGHTLLHPPPVFTLIFRKENISVCYGCKGKFAKQPAAPHDLVIQHQDYQMYTLPDDTVKHKYGNAT